MEESHTQQHTEARKLGYGPVAAILVTLAAFAGSQLFVGLVLGIVPVLLGVDSQAMEAWRSNKVITQFITVLLLEIAFLYIIWKFLQFRRVSLARIGLVKPVIRDIGYALSGYAIYFVLLIIVTSLTKELAPVIDLEQEQQIGFSTAAQGLSLVLIFISLVILPPIAEEIVFRGFLYTGLRSRLSVLVSAIVTSVLFAAAHLQIGSGAPLLWVAAIDTFILSLILVYLREKTGSLWSPILVHMIKNGLAFTALFIFKVS